MTIEQGIGCLIFIGVSLRFYLYYFSLDENIAEPENYSLDDIKTKVMVLNEKIADDMWFL